VAKPGAGNGGNAGTPVIERIVDGLGVDRENDSTVTVAPPETRRGLDTTFEPSEIAVRVNLPSPTRAAELRLSRSEDTAERPIETGSAPLLERRAPVAAQRPLSYTAIAAFEKTVLDPGSRGETREERIAHGIAVHSLLEWSAANGWLEPSAELALRYAVAAGLGAEQAEDVLAPVRAWLGSTLFAERISVPGVAARAELPLLLDMAGTVLRGSIDLLVEREGAPPLVVDYKTDRLDGADPAELADRYKIQQAIYALAVAEALDTSEVEVAYVFLERPDEPAIATLGPAEMTSGRQRLTAAIAQVEA
jgi:ATP-dependent exoDNAse (exonuclease V) beta subunit